MNSLLDEEEEGKTSEITLSTASLLGIFFGLVLICGVFFGFGYSMGRGTGRAPAAAAVATAEPEEMPASDPPRSAALAPAEQDEAPASASPPPAVARVQSDETTVAPAKAPAGKPSAAQKIPASLPAEADASATADSGKPMVQIAAVARPEDADALVAALKQRGYGVVVRNEPQDKLLHVQVGPFADCGQAAAMKQKLLSDGYNAIIKQ